MLTNGGAFFTSFYFYGLLGFVALGGVMILIGFIMQPVSYPIRPTRRQQKQQKQRLTMYGFSPLTLTQQEITTLDDYFRRVGRMLTLGLGLGIIAETPISIVLLWYLSYRMPWLLNVQLPVFETLCFIPLAVGVIFGIVVALLTSNARLRRRTSTDAENGIAVLHIPFSLYRPWWLLLMELGSLLFSIALSGVLITGLAPVEPIYISTGAGATTLQAPLWLLLAPPIAIAILLLIAEISTRWLVRSRWPAPAGVAPALAERARQRMRLQSAIAIMTFPLFIMASLLFQITLLTDSPLVLVGLFFMFASYFAWFMLLFYSVKAAQHLWTLIPLPDEENQAE